MAKIIQIMVNPNNNILYGLGDDGNVYVLEAPGYLSGTGQKVKLPTDVTPAEPV